MYSLIEIVTGVWIIDIIERGIVAIFKGLPGKIVAMIKYLYHLFIDIEDD